MRYTLSVEQFILARKSTVLIHEFTLLNHSQTLLHLPHKSMATWPVVRHDERNSRTATSRNK